MRLDENDGCSRGRFVHGKGRSVVLGVGFPPLPSQEVVEEALDELIDAGTENSRLAVQPDAASSELVLKAHASSVQRHRSGVIGVAAHSGRIVGPASSELLLATPAKGRTLTKA